MKKLLLLILVTGLLTACSNEASSTQGIISDFPKEVKAKIEKFPDDFINKLEVPTSLPESYIPVSFGYHSNPINDPNGNILMTEFTFAGDGPSHNILFSTWYQDVPPSDIEVLDTVTLENGNEANITGEFDLSWKNDKDYLHGLTLVANPNVENNLTIDDLIDIANSVE